jgi:hypothetical protein
MTSITDSFAINPEVPAERPRGGAVPTTPTPARFSDMYRGAIAPATYELVGARTGNCLRAAIALEAAGMFYTVRRLDLAAGEQHGYPHLALNPAGRVPVLTGGAAAHGAASQSPTTRIRREPTASRWPASHSSRCTSTARSRRTKPAVPSSRHGSNARPSPTRHALPTWSGCRCARAARHSILRARPWNAGAPNTVQPISPMRCAATAVSSTGRARLTSGRPRRTNEVHHCPTGHLAPGHASTARPLALSSHVPARAGISRLDRQVIALTV